MELADMKMEVKQSDNLLFASCKPREAAGGGQSKSKGSRTRTTDVQGQRRQVSHLRLAEWARPSPPVLAWERPQQ